MTGAGALCSAGGAVCKAVSLTASPAAVTRHALILRHSGSLGGAKLVLGPAFRRVLPSSASACFVVRAEAGSASGGENTEQLWRLYFSSPSQWWDERNRKRNPSDPDFIKKGTREALWIDSESTPSWVRSELDTLPPPRAQAPPRAPPRPGSSYGGSAPGYGSPRQAPVSYGSAGPAYNSAPSPAPAYNSAPAPAFSPAAEASNAETPRQPEVVAASDQVKQEPTSERRKPAVPGPLPLPGKNTYPPETKEQLIARLQANLPPPGPIDESFLPPRPKVKLSKELQDHIDIILKPIKKANSGSMRNPDSSF